MPRTIPSDRRAIHRLKQRHGIQVNRMPYSKYQAFFGAAMLIESFDLKEVIHKAPRLKNEYLAARSALTGAKINSTFIHIASKEGLAMWSSALIDACACKASLLSSKP